MSSSISIHEIAFGSKTISFTLKYTKRKTLGISVNPDMTVSVTAPDGKDIEAIVKLVKKRAPWILKQQSSFEKSRPAVTPRQYVSGETWCYLGRQYRLKVIKGEPETVKLKGRFLIVQVQDKDKSSQNNNNQNNNNQIKTLTDQWYREKALNYFTNKLEFCHEKLRKYDISSPGFQLRFMQTRWGSCTKQGSILLNPELVKLPSHCVEYVIMHEMCHLKHHDHSPEFYRLLSRVMPDWEKRKQRLDAMAHDVLPLEKP